MSLRFRCHVGAAIAPLVDDLARLRITVFRDWPYLYDGDLDYERRYLARYARGDTILVAAMAGDKVVGAATGMPLSDHAEDFARAFAAYPDHLNNAFYCAESVLLSDYRGQGAYGTFLTAREAHARDLGFTFSTFCSVVRPQDHPQRPAAYRPLDPVWRRRGYAPLEGAVARFTWRDVGAAGQSEKPLQFWSKPL